MQRKTEALPLRKIDYSETSQIIRFLTKDLGKISVIAKGSKRKDSNFSGTIDLFTVYEIVYIEKQPGNLDILTSANLQKSFQTLCEDITTFSAASYIVEFGDELVADGQRINDLYDLIINSLSDLDGKDIDSVIFNFEAKALRMLGYMPRVENCCICQEKIADSLSVVSFAARHGGILCSRCKGNDPTKIWTRRGALKYLGNFSNGGVATAISSTIKIDLRRVLNYYVCYLMEKEPRTMRFIDGRVKY